MSNGVESARRYDELFAGTGEVGTAPRVLVGEAGLSPVCSPCGEPRGSTAPMADAGIGTGVHYPVALHLQKAYEKLGYKTGDFPVAERLSSEIVSLPMFPGLTSEQQDRVAEVLIAAVRSEAMHALAAGPGGRY